MLPEPKGVVHAYNPTLGRQGRRVMSLRLACATQQDLSQKRKPGRGLIYSTHNENVKIFISIIYLCATNYSCYVFSHSPHTNPEVDAIVSILQVKKKNKSIQLLVEVGGENEK